MGIFGLKDALGGTLRQLLATSANISFTKTAWVDLGSLNWGYYSSRFYATISDAKNGVNGQKSNIISTMYVTIASSGAFYGNNLECYMQSSSDHVVIVNNTSYTDAAAFKAAMKGVLLAYEKA